MIKRRRPHHTFNRHTQLLTLADDFPSTRDTASYWVLPKRWGIRVRPRRFSADDTRVCARSGSEPHNDLNDFRKCRRRFAVVPCRVRYDSVEWPVKPRSNVGGKKSGLGARVPTCCGFNFFGWPVASTRTNNVNTGQL